jgi:glycine C-acetyltransferase
MVYDAPKAQALSKRLLELGVYVIGFFYPVVPKGQARIRVQISAVHERAQLDAALKAFETAGKELGIIQ